MAYPILLKLEKCVLLWKKYSKGVVANETTIEIASMNGTSCGPYGLKRGERYIVYAYSNKKDETTLYSGVCTRTAPVISSYAKEDLDFLRNLPPAGAGGNLRGRIWADLRAEELPRFLT